MTATLASTTAVGTSLLQFAPALPDKLNHINADAAPLQLLAKRSYFINGCSSLGQVPGAGLHAPLNILRPDPPLPSANPGGGQKARPYPTTDGLGVDLETLRYFSNGKKFGRHMLPF